MRAAEKPRAEHGVAVGGVGQQLEQIGAAECAASARDANALFPGGAPPSRADSAEPIEDELLQLGLTEQQFDPFDQRYVAGQQEPNPVDVEPQDDTGVVGVAPLPADQPRGPHAVQLERTHLHGRRVRHPLDRDPARVQWDVIEELVSEKSAREHYGVVLGKDHSIDVAATDALRAKLRSGPRPSHIA